MNDGSEYYGWSIQPIIQKRPETKVGSEDAQKAETTEELRYGVTMQTGARAEEKFANPLIQSKVSSQGICRRLYRRRGKKQVRK